MCSLLYVTLAGWVLLFLCLTGLRIHTYSNGGGDKDELREEGDPITVGTFFSPIMRRHDKSVITS